MTGKPFYDFATKTKYVAINLNVILIITKLQLTTFSNKIINIVVANNK